MKFVGLIKKGGYSYFVIILVSLTSLLLLLKAYRDMVHGKIRAISDLMQYKVDNDELGLIFQWDDCFGITVIVPKSTDLDKAYNTLKGLCESI